MKIDMKKFLLAGTAIVAVSAFSAQARAADQTLTGPGTWASAGTGVGTDVGDASDASTGDNINNVTFLLTIANDQTADDTGTAGANLDIFTLGNVTGTTGGITVTSGGAVAPGLSVTIDSVNLTGVAAVTLTNVNANDSSNTLAITGAFSTGGALAITNTETSTTDDLVMTVGGASTVTGLTGITAGAFAGASSSLTVTGNSTFTGAATVTGGAGAASNATLTLTGATNTFTAGLDLVTNDKSFLVLNGTVAQGVTGVLSGAGDINITNTHASGVTFTGDSTFTGELVVNNDTNDQTVTFNGDFAGGIFLGDNATADIITANFNGTTQAIALGIVGGAAETVDVNFLGGSTITLSGAASSGIDTLDITGSTTVTTNQNLGATAITVASGSTLATTANTITGAIANAGTLLFGGGSVTGAVTGAGLLDVNGAGTFTGAMTQGTADIAAVTLTQGSASGWTVGTTNFSGAGTLALLGGAQTITGNFTNTTDGQGTITITDVAATTAIVGNLGASTSNSLAALTIAGAGANVTTTTGNLFVDAITQNAADTLSLIGTSAQTVSGTITGGILSVGATSDVTFNGVIAGASETILGTATFNANNTLTGAHTNTGTTNVGVGAVLNADALSDTGSYVLAANDANLTLATADFGSLTDSGGNGVLTGSAADRLIINVTGQMSAGTVVLLTGINAGAATLEDNSLQYSFVTANAGADTNVTVTRASVASLGTSTPGNVSVGGVLDTLTASTDTEILAILANVASAPTQAELNEVLEATQPALDGGAMTGSLNVMSNTMNMTGTRLAALRTGETETGMAAGNISQGTRMWAQGFGQSATQDFRDGIDGYDADTYGAAVGIDSENLSNGVVGVAFSYGNTSVESDNATSTDTEVDSYQITLYGDYDLDQDTFLNGMLAYGRSNADTTRHNVGGIAGATANGDYDANTYTVRAEGGRDYAYNGMTLTPNMMGHWTHYSADSYTETGTAGGAALRNVDMDSMNIAEVGVGVDASWNLKQANGAMLEPSIGVGYRYDFVGDQVQTTAAFVGGGAAFASEGADPAQSTFDVGAALNYQTTDNWQFTVNYDFEYKSDYDAHSGFVRAAYKF